jgi:tripartite motif-containing protein 71
MRRSWCWFLILAAAVGIVSPAAAQDDGSASPPPSLEYRPPRPVLPEPKTPTPAPPVTIFRDFVGSFGMSTGSFDRPVDVATDPVGSFYVLDAGNSRVQKFDRARNFLSAFGTFGSRPGEFNNPRAIAMSPGGLLYIVDTGNHRIQQFSSDGTFIKTWGGLGSRAGNFKNPSDITFEDASTFWVLDAGNERVQRFKFEKRVEQAGTPAFAGEFGSTFADRGGVFKGLVSLAWSDDRFGYLYLLSDGCLVQQFQPDGRLERSWPAIAPESGLCVPGRIEIDEKGTNNYVYVLDAGNSLLLRFNLDGRFLAALRGAARPFSQPLGFALNPESDEFLVADTKNNIVQQFTLR